MYTIEEIKNRLLTLSPELKASVQEIRLRAGRPLTVTMGGSQFFVCKSGTYMLPRADLIYISANDLKVCFLNLCKHSVYSHNNELREGYISLENGHRAGVCGKVVLRDEKIETIRDISSINIRVAKEVPNCSDEILKCCKNGGILICGGPGTGKTTLLRSMIKKLSSGRQAKRVVVIDSRNELSYNNLEKSSLASFLIGYPRRIGIEIAIRTMNAQILVCDEIGDLIDSKAIIEVQGAGIPIVATCHGSHLADVLSHSGILELHKHKIFDYYIGLKRGNKLNYSYTANNWRDANDCL